jgi:hypothetical protein
MDCGNQYILMCEKATEIQELHKDNYGIHKWQVGDYLWDKKMDCLSIWCYFDKETQSGLGLEIGSQHLYSFDHHQDLDATFLPRQDQLQGMVVNFDLEGIHSILYRLYKFVWDSDTERIVTKSMEQLWLAFVMDKLYSKKWDGNDWVV